MEKDRNGYPQDTLDAETGYPSGREESRDGGGRGANSSPPHGHCGCCGQCGHSDEEELEPSEPLKPLEPLEPSSPSLEERVKAECRRTCRRNFWTEMLKTIAKVAGVVLAAFGLSSFDQED